MAKYNNNYRIESSRLQHWDYGWNGAYFITICTKHRHHYFGAIQGGKIQFSPVGTIADVLWHEIKNHTQHVELGEFIVMPNHIHGILILNNPDGNNLDKNPNVQKNVDANVETDADSNVQTDADSNVQTDADSNVQTDADSNVQTRHALSLQTIGEKRFQNQGKNTVSSIIGGYKSAVTKHARRLGFEFAWQTRFWDHIIQDEHAYQRISQYIKNNPQKWEDDKLNGGRGNTVLEPPIAYGEESWMI